MRLSRLRITPCLTYVALGGVAGASRRLSGSLASTAKELEKHITSDKIDRLLVSRPDVEELEQMHLLTTNVAPQLQSVQKQLQRRMSADELAHRLDNRPDVQELRDQGIVHDGALLERLCVWCYYVRSQTGSCCDRECGSESPGDAGEAPASAERRPRVPAAHEAAVTHRVNVAGRAGQYVCGCVWLANELRGLRAEPKRLCCSCHSYYFEWWAETDAQVAPSLSATAKKLERNMVQNQVGHLLETRPEKDELVTHHILDGASLLSSFLSLRRTTD